MIWGGVFMNKEQLKIFLEEYWYDNQYMSEKLKEIEKIKSQKQKISTYEIKHLDDKNSPLIIAEQQENIILRNIVKKKQKIEELIASLNQPYKTILYFKYICFLTFDQIADKMNYSTKRIYQLHGDALGKLTQIYNEKNFNVSTD